MMIFTSVNPVIRDVNNVINATNKVIIPNMNVIFNGALEKENIDITEKVNPEIYIISMNEDIKAFELRANVKAEKRMEYINKEVKKLLENI